jgi:hypothetical protein
MRSSALALALGGLCMPLWFLLALELEAGMFLRSYILSQGFDAVLGLGQGVTFSLLLPCQAMAIVASFRMWRAVRVRPSPGGAKLLLTAIAVAMGVSAVLFVGACLGVVRGFEYTSAGPAVAVSVLVEPAGEMWGLLGALLAVLGVLLAPTALLSMCVGCMVRASPAPCRTATRWLAWLTVASCVLPFGLLIGQLWLGMSTALLALGTAVLLILTWTLGAMVAIALRVAVTRSERVIQPSPPHDEAKSMKWAALIVAVGVATMVWDVLAAPGTGADFGVLATAVRMNLAVVCAGAWVLPWALQTDRTTWRFCLAASAIALGAVVVRVACFLH